MLAKILLLVCLNGSCQYVDPLLDRVELMVCMAQGQIALVQWLEEHPKYEGRGWQCQVGERRRDA